MKSQRELAKFQLGLMNEIRAKANINLVTCGHCGTLLLHSTFAERIVCFSNECKDRGEMELSDCPDYWYESCIENMEFDDEKSIYELTKEISAEDIVNVAMELGMNPSIAEINEVLKYYDSEADQDPTATWELIVENLLYNCVTPSNVK